MSRLPIVLLVLLLAGCGGGGSDHVTVTITFPYTEECERLSTAYYEAVGRRMTGDYGTDAFAQAEKDEARLEKQLTDEGCWP